MEEPGGIAAKTDQKSLEPTKLNYMRIPIGADGIYNNIILTDAFYYRLYDHKDKAFPTKNQIEDILTFLTVQKEKTIITVTTSSHKEFFRKKRIRFSIRKFLASNLAEQTYGIVNFLNTKSKLGKDHLCSYLIAVPKNDEQRIEEYTNKAFEGFEYPLVY